MNIKKSTLNSAFKKIRKSLHWTTAQGDETLISDMGKGHLQNTIIYLSKKQEECNKYRVGNYEINGMTANEWIEIMRKEWATRED